MKRLTLMLALFAIMAFSVSASATDISFSGGVTLTQTGSPGVNFTFTGLTVTPGTLGGDALEGAAVSINPNTAISAPTVAP